MGLLGLVSVFAATTSDLVDYVENYCDDLDPIDDCGSYQDEVEDAREKGTDLLNILEDMDADVREELLDDLVDLLKDRFDDTVSSKTKFLLAYYGLFFMDMHNTFSDADDLLDFLLQSGGGFSFGNHSNNNYSSYDDAEIINITEANFVTEVDNGRDEISVTYGGTLAVTIEAVDENGNEAERRDGYTVVAVFNQNFGGENVFAATYVDDGEWEFVFGNRLDDDNTVTFYLLCSDCYGSSFFDKDSVLDGWTIMDKRSYDIEDEISVGSSSSNADEDLAITKLTYDYDFVGGNEVEVELTTTIKNVGDRDIELDELEYDVEVDDAFFSSSRYDIDHIETDCDDNSIDEDEDEDIEIEEGDECEITVLFTFDEDEVEDEYLEIIVELQSNDDEYSPNNDRSVRFRVD